MHEALKNYMKMQDGTKGHKIMSTFAFWNAE